MEPFHGYVLFRICSILEFQHYGQQRLPMDDQPPPLVAYVSVALSEDRPSVMAAGHRVLDIYAKLPFYAKMFADAGFSLTDSRMVPDNLVDSLIVSGNEATVAAQFTVLLAAGLDELMITLVPIKDEADEMTRLMHLIGQL